MSDIVSIDCAPDGVTAVGATFHRCVRSMDAGRMTVLEVVMTIQDIIDMEAGGLLIVDNLRPDHKWVNGKRKRTPKRLKDWANDFANNQAIVGNLTFGINPDQCDYEITDDDVMILRSGKITTLDGATRTRAKIDAYMREPRTMDTDILVSVRFWFLRSSREGDDVAPGEITSEAVFASYQNHGSAVAQTVTRWHWQADELEEMIKTFVVRCPHLSGPNALWDSDPVNVEIEGDTVPDRSPKLWAYNSIVEAFLHSWKPWASGILVPSEDNVEWLLEFYNALVRNHPELGIVDDTERQSFRAEMLSSRNLAAHGIFGLAAKMRRDGVDLGELVRLSGTVLLDQDSPVTGGPKAGKHVKFFSLHNPEWVERGIITTKCDSHGMMVFSVGQSGRQKRDDIKRALWERVGLLGSTQPNGEAA